MRFRSQNAVQTALVLSLLVFYVSVPASAQTGHKYVRVYDADTQRPIKDAKVTIRDENGKVVKTGKTNASGMWDTRLKPGTYTIEVEKTGHGKAEGEFTIKAGATENNEFALRRVQKQSALETAGGLRTATFDTVHGKVIVNVPDDTAAGDTISGTVIAEPSGKTEAERAKNQDELNGYVVEIERQKTRVGEKVFKWAVPAAAAGLIAVTLRNRQGDPIASTGLPVQPPPPTVVPAGRPGEPVPPGGRPPFTPTPQPADYTLPKLGQAERSIEILGPCDGDFANTKVLIGGKEAELLAESPRKVIARSPSDIVGPTEIEFTEGPVTTKGVFRNVAVRLTAPKTTLLKGEWTTVTAQLSGLGGLQEEILARLENRTPGVVRMEGGDVQNFTIRPQDVQGGSYTITRKLTGIGAGGFEIGCQVQQQPDLCPTGWQRHIRGQGQAPTVEGARAAARRDFEQRAAAFCYKHRCSDPKFPQCKLNHILEPPNAYQCARGRQGWICAYNASFECICGSQAQQPPGRPGRQPPDKPGQPPDEPKQPPPQPGPERQLPLNTCLLNCVSDEKGSCFDETLDCVSRTREYPYSCVSFMRVCIQKCILKCKQQFEK